MSKTENPKPEERVCFNCKHVLWMVGIGLGVRCGHKYEAGFNKLPPTVPSRFHTCENFTDRKEK